MFAQGPARSNIPQFHSHEIRRLTFLDLTGRILWLFIVQMSRLVDSFERKKNTIDFTSMSLRLL